jgi:hypothetical protein
VIVGLTLSIPHDNPSGGPLGLSSRAAPFPVAGRSVRVLS